MLKILYLIPLLLILLICIKYNNEYIECFYPLIAFGIGFLYASCTKKNS